MEKLKVSMEIVRDYGENTIGYWGKLDLNTLSLKTAQCLLFEDLNKSFVIFPKAGMIVSGNVYQLRNLDTIIKESVYMELPTPVKSDAKIILKFLESYRKYFQKKHQDKLIYQCQLNGLTPDQTIGVYEWLMGFPLGWTKEE